MSSKYKDTTAIMQIIGCTFNNPQLLDFDDKYVITDDDFPDDFHKTVFGAIYKIHELGSKEITLENLSDFFSSRPKSEGIYKSNDGEKWLLTVADKANPLTFDYYYGRLKKMTLLRAYDNCGIDVSDIYDPDNILDTKKKQLQEDILDNSSLEEIAIKVDKKIEDIKLRFVDDANGEASQAADGLEDLVENLKKSPEMGVPLYGSLVNTIHRGARLGKFYLRSASTGTGKAIPNDTLIPTPLGWRQVGEIKVGDYLFGQDGKPTKILATYPQPEKKRIWEVTFIDGRTAKCCEEHLWEYRYKTHSGHSYRVESLKEIYNRTLKLKNGLRNSDGRGFRFKIKINEPVEYPEKQYTISPYAMGLILGDGSLRYDNTNKALSFSSETDELPNYLAQELKAQPIKSSKFNYNYTFRVIDKNNKNHNLWVKEIFANYPELWQVKSEDKFIPKDYLYGSVEQRWSLLAGLMDTDGSIQQEKGRTQFTTISPQLRDDVIELCHSLGMVTSWSTDLRTEKYTTGECYSIHIQCKKSLKEKMFHLKRKKNIAIAYANNGKREEHKEFLSIIDIHPTEEFADMTCFTVDNESHLFLMNDFITTHNTRAMMADMCYIGCNKIYDEIFGWVSTGPAQPSLFIATEQDLSECQTLALAFISNVPEEHILYGKYEGDEEDRIKEAIQVLKNSELYIETIPDFSLQDIENLIRKNIRDHDVKYIGFDYIHTSIKILSEITRRSGGIKIREDNVLFMLSDKLKSICVEYGVFIESSTQLNGQYVDSETPDQNLLRGAKSIADRIDFGNIMLKTTQKDIEALEPILSSNAFDVPKIKISVYKNRRGRYSGMYLWCKADLGTCRINPMFATDYGYELIQINDMKILVDDEEQGAF